MKKSVPKLLMTFAILSNVVVAQTEQKWALKFDSTHGYYVNIDLGTIGQNCRSICANWQNSNIQAGWDYGKVGGQNAVPANLVPHDGVGFSLSSGQRIDNVRATPNK